MKISDLRQESLR